MFTVKEYHCTLSICFTVSKNLITTGIIFTDYMVTMCSRNTTVCLKFVSKLKTTRRNVLSLVLQKRMDRLRATQSTVAPKKLKSRRKTHVM